MAQIICFGDSITQGYTDTVGGWTQRLRQYFDSNYITKFGDTEVPSHDVFNLGISGDTSSGLLKRLKNEAQPRLLGDQTVIVIAIGTNDSVFRLSDNSVESTPEQFEAKLRLLVTQAWEFTEDVILVGLLPCDEDKVQPMPWSTSGKSYSNDRLELFNNIIVKVGSELGLKVANVFDYVSEHEPINHLADGVHPNSEGHTVIAYEVQHVIEKIIRR